MFIAWHVHNECIAVGIQLAPFNIYKYMDYRTVMWLVDRQEEHQHSRHDKQFDSWAAQLLKTRSWAHVQLGCKDRQGKWVLDQTVHNCSQLLRTLPLTFKAHILGKWDQKLATNIHQANNVGAHELHLKPPSNNFQQTSPRAQTCSLDKGTVLEIQATHRWG